jgi:hypothetical protein
VTPAARPPAPPAEEEAAVPETGDAELVSLEDADAESQGKSLKTDSAEDSEDDIEIDENLDDSTFIEEQEEGDEDVTDIIGDVDDEEES